MFAVTEAEATAIRDALYQRGEFSAAVELRRLFPGITDNRQARECVRIIAGWKPLSLPLRPVRRRSGQAAAAAPLIRSTSQSRQSNAASATVIGAAKK